MVVYRGPAGRIIISCMATKASGTPRSAPWNGRLSLALGHRGAPRQAPENRREALAAALACLDGIETDLQRTNDGVLVINHDPHIGPLPELSAVISRNDLAALRSADPDLLTLADLRELLEEYPEAVVNLELKTSAPGGDPRAVELAEELATWPDQVAERVWVSSFDPLELLRLAEQGVAAHLAYLVAEDSALALLPHLPVSAVHPHYTLVTRERVDQWHEAGLAVFTWTVNDDELAARMLEAGVDGIIGDEPQVLLDALAARR